MTMRDLSVWSERAIACLQEASDMRRKIADQLGDVIADLGADEAGKRHALLELRSWLASAEQELALATGRVQAIADRLTALAKDQERTEMINTEMRDEDA